MKKNLICYATVLCLLAGAGFAASAETGANLDSLLRGMAANAKQLQQYTFKQRTETHYKGELKNAKVSEVHYTASGERVVIPLDEQKTASEPRRRIGPGSRFIAKRIEAKQEETKEYVERLSSLAARYLAAEPAALQRALVKADVTMAGGLVRLSIRDFVKPGDRLTMTFDGASKRPLSTEVTTTLDEGPVTMSVAFDQVREGPSYPRKTLLKSPDKQLEVQVFTYDYRL